jgi:hypothetical protein
MAQPPLLSELSEEGNTLACTLPEFVSELLTQDTSMGGLPAITFPRNKLRTAATIRIPVNISRYNIVLDKIVSGPVLEFIRKY